MSHQLQESQGANGLGSFEGTHLTHTARELDNVKWDDGQQVHGEPGAHVVLRNFAEAVLPLNPTRRGIGVHGEELDDHVLAVFWIDDSVSVMVSLGGVLNRF